MLLSKPEPEPLPAPPFCGMQVTPALLKDLYSRALKPAWGLQIKYQRHPPQRHMERNSDPKSSGFRRKQCVPSWFLFLFPPRLVLEEQIPSSSAGLSRKFLSAHGRGQWGKWGELISSHRFPSRCRIISTSYPGPGSSVSATTRSVPHRSGPLPAFVTQSQCWDF